VKIGILDQTCAGWSGGASYTRALLTSLAAAETNGSPHENRLVFLAREGNIGLPDRVQSASFRSIVQAFAISRRRISDFGLDVVLPVRDHAVHDIPTAKVGWIPDFQHYRLPELFSLNDLAARDALFDTIARDCQLVIVSSESARKDFETFLPLFTAKARVLSFPSILWAAPLRDDPQQVVLKYHLPAKYALVANQFWRHKNHSVLPEALSILKRQGIEAPLVLTGLPADYRDTENKHVSEFFQACARLGVANQVHFLGHLPYWDMISIMRSAAVVIQPSRFEGWNTSVEDAKALGRPLLCSDIPVHREQAPEALGFFEATSSEQLAQLLSVSFPNLNPGPTPPSEESALARSKAQALEFGRSLLSIAQEAYSLKPPRVAISEPVAGEMQEPRAVVDEPRAVLNKLERVPPLRKKSPGRTSTYLVQKVNHLRYIVGKYSFHVSWWLRHLHHGWHHMHQLSHLPFELIFKSRANELGVLRQYAPRPVRPEHFPARGLRRDKCPTIAIVTPTFNQGHTLHETIRSVLSQDYPRLEYAVVDGGSSDETKEVLAKFKSSLSYCVSEPDRGQADAIVKGFQHLQGDIMAYLNSDDLLMPGALSFIGRYFATHPEIDVIYGHRVVVDENGAEVGRWILPRHDARAIRHFDYVPQETLFWRRSIYARVGGIDPAFHFAMDWDLLLRFIAAKARFSRVPYFLACFRVHQSQKTHTLCNSVGERERVRLLMREHPEGCHAKSVQKMQDWYRVYSRVCAALLRHGIRY
jgi:glycosyltransferase involved in cell wall biosynthesis/GT2 family glycosyltransferase